VYTVKLGQTRIKQLTKNGKTRFYSACRPCNGPFWWWARGWSKIVDCLLVAHQCLYPSYELFNFLLPSCDLWTMFRIVFHRLAMYFVFMWLVVNLAWDTSELVSGLNRCIQYSVMCCCFLKWGTISTISLECYFLIHTKLCNPCTRRVHSVYMAYTLNEGRTNDYRLAFRSTLLLWCLFCLRKYVCWLCLYVEMEAMRDGSSWLVNEDRLKGDND
jgi:hypothetical protein